MATVSLRRLLILGGSTEGFVSCCSNLRTARKFCLNQFCLVREKFSALQAFELNLGLTLTFIMFVEENKQVSRKSNKQIDRKIFVVQFCFAFILQNCLLNWQNCLARGNLSKVKYTSSNLAKSDNLVIFPVVFHQ